MIDAQSMQRVGSLGQVAGSFFETSNPKTDDRY